jgi:predicted amidophosphoribosyltransferase
LREAVILTKKRSYETLRIGLAQLLVETLEAKFGCLTSAAVPPLLVPVPNHWSHTFSQAAPTANSLAFAVGRQIGAPVNTRIVRRTRKTAKQGMLSWAERKQNVRGAFEIRATDGLKGRHIWLIDDVLTSGATAAELASCLQRAGACDVSVLVIARGTGARDRSQFVNSMESNVKS